MQDVAREAKLSVASVSRALSGAASRQVGDDVLKEVRRAASKLGYQLNPIARALRVGRSDIVGLVVPDIALPFFSALASGLEAVLRGAGLGMFLLDAGNDPALERQCISQLIARRVDKIIISPVQMARSRATRRLCAILCFRGPNRPVRIAPSPSGDNGPGEDHPASL